MGEKLEELKAIARAAEVEVNKEEAKQNLQFIVHVEPNGMVKLIQYEGYIDFREGRKDGLNVLSGYAPVDKATALLWLAQIIHGIEPEKRVGMQLKKCRRTLENKPDAAGAAEVQYDYLAFRARRKEHEAKREAELSEISD